MPDRELGSDFYSEGEARFVSDADCKDSQNGTALLLPITETHPLAFSLPFRTMMQDHGVPLVLFVAQLARVGHHRGVLGHLCPARGRAGCVWR